MTHRFVATSYNIWTTTWLEERAEPLRAYLNLTRPDLLCLQELTLAFRTLIDETLPDHVRVEDEFEGWEQEGTIYWSREMFRKLEHGAEDLGQYSPLSRLFWVPLHHVPSGCTVLVSTAHLTGQGHPRSREEGHSPATPRSRRPLRRSSRSSAPTSPSCS